MDKTFLTIRELAVKMGVSGKTIYRLLKDNQIPFAVKIGGQWRFRTDAMEGWISAQSGMDAGNRQINSDISISEALRQGAVIYRIHGQNRDEAVDELLSAVPYSASFDKKSIKVSIFAKESLASSSLQGIAYMRTSSERPVFFEKSMLLLAFLENPMDFKALDRMKTEAVFLILPANQAEQTILEMKLRRLSADMAFVVGIKKQLTRRELFDFLRAKEREIFE